ncbi:MAG: GntR family transcriptional regulator [Desulfobacteraceae bacterium]|jgi:GntR family transcriptional repressor for pyruvate dehydrogenase complex
MEFEAIKKASAPQMVAEQIIKNIEAGRLSPGGRLPAQRDLARQLGVGRSSIREAINALVVLGYLEVIQGKGTYIRQRLPQTDQTMEKLDAALAAGTIFDLMEARLLLESSSASLAAQRAGKSQIRKLTKAVAHLKTNNREYTLFLEADMAFHKAVAEATGNVVICEMTKLILEKLVAHHASLKTKRLSAKYRATSIETAARVVEHIRKQDERNASLWMEKHLNAIREELQHISL